MLVSVDGLPSACLKLRNVTGWSRETLARNCEVALGTILRWETCKDKTFKVNKAALDMFNKNFHHEVGSVSGVIIR